ncbi:MAG: PTS mannitol transporter subunit IIBC, partial [Vallitaleaceae bacterium]|nr:PTS mannitol transporter subunit IIBC [Vallitaleaceae bacterium]
MESTEKGKSGSRESLQKFGRFLSGMVMPNIGAFIAWGLITALFIPTGWLPNENLATLVGP